MNKNFTQTEQNFLNVKEVKSNLQLSKFERTSKAAGNYRIKAFERTILESQMLSKGCDYLQSKEGKKLRKEYDVFPTKVDYGQKIYGVGKALINRLHNFGKIEEEFFEAYVQFGNENNLMFTSSIEIVLKVYEVLKNDESRYTAQDVKDVFDAWSTKDEKKKGTGTVFSLKEDGTHNISTGDIGVEIIAKQLIAIAKQLLEEA